MKAVCIATSRKDNEPVFTELYRQADTGEPFLLYINLNITPRKKESITPEQARQYMQAWNIPEADIIAEWG